MLTMYLQIYTDISLSESVSSCENQDYEKNDWYYLNTSKPYNTKLESLHGKHKCPFCGRFFSTPSQVHQHIRTHTGERPFKCFICDAAFTQKGRLTVHIRTHTGEKPFKCGMCKFSSVESCAVKKHIVSKHKI